MATRSEVERITQCLAGPAPASSDYDLNPDVVLPEGRRLKDAAVLIALMQAQGGTRVILTKRASHLKHHPGQVAFPGGKMDATDGSAEEAALREAEEEIALPRDKVEILGRLSPHETVTSYQVVPVIGRITSDFIARAEPCEVDEIFSVPLDFLLDPSVYRIERRRWRGVWRSYYTAPYGPYYIWGATARMLKGLADRVAACG